MSQIGQVLINYNIPETSTNRLERLPKSFIIGLSQRGPVYIPTNISDINTFLTVFGQPTNEYEFDFFQAVKSTVEAGGIAICYRIPYTDTDKRLYDIPFEYYISDLSKIKSKTNIVFEDISTHKKYKLYAKENRDKLSLYILETDEDDSKQYVIFQNMSKQNDYYKIYISDAHMYMTLCDEAITESYYTFLQLGSEDAPDVLDHIVYLQNKKNGKAGLFLEKVAYVEPETDDEQQDIAESNIYDIVYRRYNDGSYDFSDIPGAKLTFTLINDFNSAFVFNEDFDTLNNKLRKDCYNTKLDTNPSQIFGIFPVLFGPKDAENLRNVEPSKLCYLDNYVNGLLYVDNFETFTFKKNKKPFQLQAVEKSILGKFKQFEKSAHFKNNWLETELANLIDKYIPQDISECKNTIGVAFVALYLDDNHKLDYKIIESFYGTVGLTTKYFKNIEDEVNEHSNFFHLDVEGSIDNNICVRALNRKAFIYSVNEKTKRWLAPLCSPYTPDNEHIVCTHDIFAYEPTNKYSERFSIPLSKLYDILSHSEFYNTVPFDYVLSTGLADVLLLTSNATYENNLKSCVSYNYDKINLDDKDIKYIDVANRIAQPDSINTDGTKQYNVRSLYRLLAMYTAFGDKGTFAFIDIPKPYNMLINDKINDCHSNEKKIKDLLKYISYPQTSYVTNKYDIFPPLNGSREIYDRTYPLFNYQYVDKDIRLTRYNRFKRTGKFEIVPASVEVINAYINADNLKNYGAIAGSYIINEFIECHKSFVDNNIKLFKILFDLYGVTSLMNDKDNGTFPIQQTTWRNTTSVLKQIHAYRIYIALRRQTYDICKSYLYESNIEENRNNLQSSLNYLLSKFKENKYIDNQSSVNVYANIDDIEQNQIQVEMSIGIFGAIVKIIINMNITNMKIEIV